MVILRLGNLFSQKKILSIDISQTNFSVALSFGAFNKIDISFLHVIYITLSNAHQKYVIEHQKMEILNGLIYNYIIWFFIQ